MNLEAYIADLFEKIKAVWNSADMTEFAELLDENVEVRSPGLEFCNVTIDGRVIKGKEAVLQFFEKSRRKLPIKASIDEFVEINGKRVCFKAHYYELDLWSLFECALSKYGKINLIVITRLNDKKSSLARKIYVAKNIARHNFLQLFK